MTHQVKDVLQIERQQGWTLPSKSCLLDRTQQATKTRARQAAPDREGEREIAVNVCRNTDFTDHPQAGGQHCNREVLRKDLVGSKGQQAFSS